MFQTKMCLKSFYTYINRLEYVFSYWSDGDINLLCNDWHHTICPQRLDSDTSIVLSCQPNSGLRKGPSAKDIIYPISRGKPVILPSMNYLINSHSFHYGQDRLNVPWTGMTILNSENSREIQLLAVNAVGDIFQTVLNHDSRYNLDLQEQNPDLNTTLDFDAESVRSFNTSFNKSEDVIALEHLNLPSDNYNLEWMKFRQLHPNEHNFLESWESKIDKYRKISFASEIFQRDALPQNIDKRLIHTFKEIPIQKKVIEYRYLDGKFKNCPLLPSLEKITQKNKDKNYKYKRSKSKHNIAPTEEILDQSQLDKEAQDVLKIFNNEHPSIFDNIRESSDESDSNDYESIKSKKRKKELAPELPEDTRYTMDQFLQDLDPEMTSTQQSQLNETSIVETEEYNAGKPQRILNPDKSVDSSSMHDVQSRGSSKKKKKKRVIAGF